MRQSGGADHERKGNGEQVEFGALSFSIFRKTQVLTESIEFIEQVDAFAANGGVAKPKLRDGIPGKLDGDKNSGDHEGKNQNAVLCHLGVGDAFHPAEYGVKENDRHSDNDSPEDADIEEFRENDADAPHLAANVCE